MASKRCCRPLRMSKTVCPRFISWPMKPKYRMPPLPRPNTRWLFRPIDTNGRRGHISAEVITRAEHRIDERTRRGADWLTRQMTSSVQLIKALGGGWNSLRSSGKLNLC